jgi:hypothetical protein
LHSGLLGPEVASNNIVKNSKLLANERNYFDRELSIQELDIAVNKMNLQSAGGLDGIPTKFLKKFWAYFRYPLTVYANFLFESGHLTQSFNSAGIKLIPKKGDITKIKNWRPISLLNVFKIVLSRGQKGFTSKRNLHECIINITETIAFAETEKVPAFVLALDMAKAFDTVQHDYMLHVYKFFGLGEKFVCMLDTISTGRTACIIKDNNQIMAPFPLGTGFPQGSLPSPNQFNLGEQLLIFKIELDPRIRPIRYTAQINCQNLAPPPIFWEPDQGGPDPIPVPAPVPLLAPAQNQNKILNGFVVRPPGRVYGYNESRRNTEKVEAFADDNNVMALLDRDALLCIRDILTNFAEISSLKCNVDKSQIMIIGTDTVPDFVNEAGFARTNELKILGFLITKNFAEISNNLIPAVEKIQSLIRYWDRFRLSLPGRINVAKSLLLSQIGFFATIIPVSEHEVNTLQKLINDLVTGSLQIEKKTKSV